MKTIDELLSDMDKLVKDAEAENRSLTDDEVSIYEGFEKDLVSARKADEVQKRNSAYQAPRVNMITASPKGDEALEFAYTNYLKTGQVNQDITHLEVRTSDQNIGSNAAGGFLVPPGYLVKIVERLKNYGGIARVGEEITTASGQPLQWPTNDDTANQGEIVAEAGVTASGADLTFGSLTLGAFMYRTGGADNAGIKASLQLIQDSAFDVGAFVAKKVGQRIGRKQAAHLATGTGSSQPKGLFFKIPDVMLATGNALVYSGPSTAPGLLQVVHKLDPDYRTNAVWIMNDATLALIEGIVDTTGRPLLMPFSSSSISIDPGQAGQATDGAGYRTGQTLLGYPVIVDQASPIVQNASVAPPGAAGDAFLAFGDPYRYYLIRRVQGVTILADPYSRANNGEMVWHAFARMDANIQDPNAMALLCGFHA